MTRSIVIPCGDCPAECFDCQTKLDTCCFDYQSASQSISPPGPINFMPDPCSLTFQQVARFDGITLGADATCEVSPSQRLVKNVMLNGELYVYSSNADIWLPDLFFGITNTAGGLGNAFTDVLINTCPVDGGTYPTWNFDHDEETGEITAMRIAFSGVELYQIQSLIGDPAVVSSTIFYRRRMGQCNATPLVDGVVQSPAMLRVELIHEEGTGTAVVGLWTQS